MSDDKDKSQATSGSKLESVKNSAPIKFILGRPLLKGIVAVAILYLLKMGGCAMYNMTKSRTVKELEDKGVLEKPRRHRSVNM